MRPPEVRHRTFFRNDRCFTPATGPSASSATPEQTGTSDTYDSSSVKPRPLRFPPWPDRLENRRCRSSRPVRSLFDSAKSKYLPLIDFHLENFECPQDILPPQRLLLFSRNLTVTKGVGYADAPQHPACTDPACNSRDCGYLDHRNTNPFDGGRDRCPAASA
jgi:hypothetical protein